MTICGCTYGEGPCGCGSLPATLDFQTYTAGALLTDTTSDFPWDYFAVAIGGEAGEILEHVKKSKRDDGGILTPERREKIIKEMGDVLWYLAVCAHRLNIGLDEVAQINLDKLAARKENGTLHGDGDDR
jgi:NTP pyrophosphatase (non-canonical NTP hydrolase)